MPELNLSDDAYADWAPVTIKISDYVWDDLSSNAPPYTFYTPSGENRTNYYKPGQASRDYAFWKRVHRRRAAARRARIARRKTCRRSA